MKGDNVVNDTKKYDRGLSTLLHDELHWIDVSERVTYTSSASWRTVVCTVKHLQVTSLITSLQPPKSLHFFVCAPPTDTSSSFLAVDSAPIVVARRSGARYQTNSEIRRVVLIALGSFLKQSSLAFTSVTSALEVFKRYATMRYNKSTFCLLYLLTLRSFKCIVFGLFHTNCPIVCWQPPVCLRGLLYTL